MRLERSPANQFVGIDCYDSILDAHSKQFEGPCRRRTEHITSNIECRGMAGAYKFLLIRDPGHRATEMRAFAVQGQKPAIFQARQVEVTVTKRGNTARFELLNWPGDLNPGTFLQRHLAPA